MTPITQSEHATDLLESQAGEEHPDAKAPEAPQTPFPTSLILSRDQEDRMVDFAYQYIRRLCTEMGREIKQVGSTSVPDPNTHLGKREIYTMRYYNHVDDRPARDPNGIYGKSNVTATLSQRTTRQMIARANNYFYGSAPWFSCDFVGIEDKPKAQKVDRHAKWKFEQTGLQRVGEQANEFAFVRGESVVKTIYDTRIRHYKKKGKALFDNTTGNLLTDTKGNPVFADDRWEDKLTLVESPDGVQPPQTAASGRKVLKRDPKVLMPAEGVREVDGIYDMRRTIFEGPESQIVYFKDFLCPLSAKDVHSAELVAHLYDLPIMTLVSTFKRMDLAAQGAKDSFASLKKAVDAIRMMSGGGTSPMSAALQPRGDFKEQGNEVSPENPYAEIAEVYLSYDADGDGIVEEIMLVLDMKNQFPLFYDYLDNVTPKGRRPFEVVRPIAIDGRWYGMGAMEYFQPEQEFIDLQINRKNFRQSKAGRVTFWNPAATMEGQSQPNLKLNDGGTYRLREGMKPEDALGYVSLPEDGADLMELVNFFNQLMQLKSGIINAGDQQASGMDTGDTATGINNVERSGQELFSDFLSCLKPGHQAILLSNVVLLYSYISEVEMFRFFDPATNSTLTDTISPEEVADMEFDVRVLLTRVKTEQVLQTNQQSVGLIREFYAPMPPPQEVVAPFYRDALRSLGNQNADDLIVPQPLPQQPIDPNTGQPMQEPPAGEAAEQPPLV